MTDIEPVPAATVVLIRENSRQQELEVLLVQRNSRLPRSVQRFGKPAKKPGLKFPKSS